MKQLKMKNKVGVINQSNFKTYNSISNLDCGTKRATDTQNNGKGTPETDSMLICSTDF